MPEISLLQPTVLRGVVEKFATPESLELLGTLPKTPWPFPSATWDVIRGSRTVAKPNVPNSEAHIVPKLGVSQESAAFVYLREKKVFEPTTIHWLRQPGTLAATNAEAAVLREVTDLNQRFDNFVEWCIWQALTGTLVITGEDVNATVDYKFPASHINAVPGTSWETATPQQIRSDVLTWRRLIRRDSRIDANRVYATEFTMNRIMNAFVGTPLLLSDRMRDQFFANAVIPGFLGLDWRSVEQTYQTDQQAGSIDYTLFLPDDALIMGNFDSGRPIELMEGPSADDEAPDNFTGKFSKTWKERDPSARQFLLEYNFLPVITRPEQFLFVPNVTP